MTRNQFKSIQSTSFKHRKWLTASRFLDMPCNNITSHKYLNQWWTNNNLAQAFTILSIPTKEFGFQNRDKVCLHKC